MKRGLFSKMLGLLRCLPHAIFKINFMNYKKKILQK